MTFLQPFAVWLLAGLPIIVLLYFLRLKRRSVTVSTHLFWQRVLTESSRRAFFQRLRHLLSLLLHLLIFALIVGALSRPLFERKIFGGLSTVLILDARARMQAIEEDGQTRFAKAIAAAREYIRQANNDREIAILVMNARATVALPFTSDEKLLRDAIGKVSVTDAGGDMNSAVDLAGSLLASRSGGRLILLISDRAAGGPTPVNIEHLTSHVVGTPRDNLAITRFATRPLPANAATSEVLLELQNFGAKPATTDLELTFDGRPLEVKPFTLGPGEKRQEIFSSVPRPARSARGWLVAKIAKEDALALDNVAYATLPSSKASRVLLISRGNPFLEKFLAVDPGIKFEMLAPEEWTPAFAQKFEVVIFDASLPAAFDIAAVEQSGGNFLFLKNTPFGSAATLDQPLVTDVDFAHPVTRRTALQSITIAKASALAMPTRDGWTFAAPLRSFDHPLIVAGERKQQRVVAVAFDVLDSDLPLRVAFPMMMSGAIRWLAGSPSEAPPTALAGETITLASDERIASEPVTTPPKVSPSTAVSGFFQPMRNGFYSLGGEPTRWLAVNTFSAAESELRSSGPVSMSAPAWHTPQFAAIPPWQWLAIAALALFTVEWWLFHRRKTE